MANSIALREEWAKELDSEFKDGAYTSGMEANNLIVRGFDEAGTVQYLDMDLDGLGDYDRATGFPTGDIVTTWKTHTIAEDRAQSFQVDNMDNAESADMVFGNISMEFQKQHVIPEVDAYRFAQLASKAGTSVEADLTLSTAVQAYDTAVEVMDDAEVPQEGRVMFVSNEMYKFMKQSDLITRDMSVQNNNGTVDRGIERLDDGTPVVRIPRGRFYDSITLNDGTGDAWGYVKTATTGRDLNFILVHVPSIMAITRHVAIRTFTPEVNQTADAYKYQLRLYHDLLVNDNKVNAIYSHNKTT
jgi:hypothetical protein